MNIEKPYFSTNSDNSARTEAFATLDEAIKAACLMELAPFVVYQLLAQPVAQRLTNMALPQAANGKHQ